MPSRQTSQAVQLPGRAPDAASSAPAPDALGHAADALAEVRTLATRSASRLVQSRTEAWAVVHCAERLGYRDISDALHHTIESVADAGDTDEVVQTLDAARDHALARLDACGALGGDADAS